MKTLLFVSHKMNLGGTEKALLSLISALENQPVKITLLLLEKGGILTSKIPRFVDVKYMEGFDEIKPIIVEPPLKTLGKKLMSLELFDAQRFFLLYLKIKITGNWYYNYEKVLKNYSHFGCYDVAVAFAGPSDFITYFVYKKVSANKKVQWIHFDIEKVISNFNFGKKYYPFFDKIFCVSQSAMEIFLKHFPNQADKTSVFHNIVSEVEIKNQAALGETFEDKFDGIRILTVGRFTKEKGQHLIPEVARQLKLDKINFRWYLVGDGLEKGKVEQMGFDLGVTDQLFFLGEKENPYRYMQDCDIYVQPSLHEGYGITVAEARVFNRPIVITDFASAKDLIEHEVTGLICGFSPEEIYKSLKIFFSNPQLVKQLMCNLDKVKSSPIHQVEKLTSML